ncbi:hypothetical protein [Amycolatopsis anabasis]|uniref:hypothetical protein n=1 Tax=Amycolatopsis anabasis TaxID=1840409 RepID=UPI00131C4616|nr:hypothetical protein [Amycolatopsis anabasis]
MTEQATEQAIEWPPEEPESGAPPRLHRPWRALVAAGELVVAALAVWAAFPSWSAAISTVSLRLTDGTVLTSTRLSGSWIAAAIGFGALAAVLVVDAVRQLLLAVRARHRKHRGKPNKSANIADTYGPDFA